MGEVTVWLGFWNVERSQYEPFLKGNSNRVIDNSETLIAGVTAEISEDDLTTA
jgi:hypothetical protein